MFIPRRILAVLLIGAVAFSLPVFTRAADENETPKSASVKAKAKPSPSASPKKTSTAKPSDGSTSGSSKKPAVSSESKKTSASDDSKKSDPSDKPASKKTDKTAKPASKKEDSKKPEAKPAEEKEQKSEKSDKAGSGKSGSPKPEGASSEPSEHHKSKKSKAKPKPATLKRHAKPGADSAFKPEPEKKPEPKIEREKLVEKPAEKPAEPRQSAPSAQPAQSAQASRAVSQPSDQAVVVTKSGAAGEQEEAAPPPAAEPERRHWWWPFGHGSRYKYLTPRVRDAIDDARVPSHKWRYIVVHNSGTRQGSAKAFDYYHRYVRKMPNGLAYHFVIGNGTSTADGAIEIGPRWVGQIQGGHVHSDYLNSIALGVCLVGDYNKDQPTKAQLEALDELVKYLRKRVGKTDHHLAVVKPHRDINPPQWPTDCPGDRFPYQWLNDKFEDQ